MDVIQLIGDTGMSHLFEAKSCSVDLSNLVTLVLIHKLQTLNVSASNFLTA